MSNVIFAISPTFNSLIDSRKGTAGNKVDCAVNHFGNALKYNAVIGTAAGLAGAVGYGRVAKQAINGSTLKNVLNVIKAIPTPVKAIAGGVIVLAEILKNYHKGKIEQKFLDRAQFVDRTYTDNYESKAE